MSAQRVREYHDLLLAADRYAALFSALADGIVVTDARGRVADANPAAARILGRPRLVGAELAEILPPGRAEIVERRDDRVVVRRWRVPAEDRETVLEVVTTLTVDERGAAFGAIHTVRDITAQAQLARLKEEFLFEVAHELRTPLSSLTASLDLLREDAARMPPAELEGMLETLSRSAIRLEAFVENLLDVGSIQAGTFEVRAVPTSLRRCVEDGLLLVRPMADMKRQSVRVALDAAFDRVVADPRRTAQVVANLVANAAKYSPEGSAIELASTRDDGFVRLDVRDRGPGIPQEERARVFDRFYRARMARSAAGGIGLGLSICRAIVEAQGGVIGIGDAPGGGALVHFTLPLARAEAAS